VEIGARSRMQNHCVVGPGSVIEEDCFLGPGVQVLTGRTMGRAPRAEPPVLRQGCQVGAGAKIMPGIEVGAEAVVGAGAVVLADVPAGKVVRGIPAQIG
jgi:acetyltransferase-like isoleucine patch superfamily enzyme